MKYAKAFYFSFGVAAVISAFLIFYGQAYCIGAENPGLKHVITGYLSERPRSDAQIILKKVRDSLELRGINGSEYEIKYIAETNAFIIRSKDADTGNTVRETITSIEKYYYETVRSEVIYLQYAGAKSVMALLNNIYTPRIFCPPAPVPAPGPGHAPEKAGGPNHQVDPRMKIIKKRNESIDIVCDDRTNALLVNAPQNVIDLVKDTVQKIDRRTSLVHVKVLIAEVSIDDTSQFGLEWKYAAQNNISGNSVQQRPGVDFGNLNDPAKQAKLQGLKYSVLNGEKFNSFLQMLNTKNNVNVLSSPQLLTTNNSKAYFEETIKVPTIQKVTTSTGVISDSIEYQEIGIKLAVTPQVNRDEFINLKIDQTIQNIINMASDLSAPTFSHRMINTNVITRNGSTVIISGFIKNNVTRSVYRTPVFDRIPFVKDIFSKKSTKNEKTELMVFITPKIVSTDGKMENIVENLPAGSDLKKKLVPVSEKYNDYEQETNEGRFVVIDVKDEMVILNGGKKDDIKEDDVLCIYRGIDSRNAGGDDKNEKGLIAEIRVEMIKDKTAYARVVKKYGGIRIKSGDFARWPSGEAEYFEDLRQTGYKNEEYLGIKERKFVRTLTVKNITSAPLEKAEAVHVSMSPNLKYFFKAGKEFVPLKMVKKYEKDKRSYITVYLPRAVAPGEEFTIKTEDTIADNLMKYIENQAKDPGHFSDIRRTVTKYGKTNMVMIIHHPYKIRIRGFDPEPMVMDNQMGGHSIIWTFYGRTFNATGKWRYENAEKIYDELKKENAARNDGI